MEHVAVVIEGYERRHHRRHHRHQLRVTSEEGHDDKKVARYTGYFSRATWRLRAIGCRIGNDRRRDGDPGLDLSVLSINGTVSDRNALIA